MRQRGVHTVSADQIKAFMNNEQQDGNGENVPVTEHRQQSRQIEDAAMVDRLTHKAHLVNMSG